MTIMKSWLSTVNMVTQEQMKMENSGTSCCFLVFIYTYHHIYINDVLNHTSRGCQRAIRVMKYLRFLSRCQKDVSVSSLYLLSLRLIFL